MLKILIVVAIIGVISIASAYAISNANYEQNNKIQEYPTMSSLLPDRDNQVILCNSPGETDPSNCYNSFRDGPLGP